VKIADDGKIYVCDRGNDRIQVFDSNDSALANPAAIRWRGRQVRLSGRTGDQRQYRNPSAMPGTSVSLNFSKDRGRAAFMSATIPI